MRDKGNVALGALLVGLRRSAGLTQEDLADRTQLTVRAIGDLEGGRVTRPRRSTVARLAEALGPDPATEQRLWLMARPIPAAAARSTGPVGDADAAEVLTETLGPFLRAVGLEAGVAVHVTVSVTCGPHCSSFRQRC